MSDPASAPRAAFRRLHASGCFVMPNPWDVGSARYLLHLGFPALATTSAGFAFSHGLPDAGWAVPRDLVLGHCAEIVRAAGDVPVNADFEGGYAHDPEDVARNVALCVATGVAGLSIEDATGDPAHPLYAIDAAAARIRAARRAIDETAAGVLLTARAECFLTAHPDPLRESVRRLEAYAAAGADVLYAPGLRTPEQIRTVVGAVSPKPVNVLAIAGMSLTAAALAELGVRRISLGSALARAAWTGFLHAAREISTSGTFTALDGAVPYPELNDFFRRGT